MLKKQSDHKTKILITGGAGFIGSHLVEKLRQQYEVTIFDNFRRDALKFLPQDNQPEVHKITGTVLDSSALKAAIDSAHIVFHLAAIAGVSSYEKNPLQTLEVDALGTYNVLNLASQSKVKQVIIFSSSEVYGPNAVNVNEKSPTIQGDATQSRWSYSVGKLVGDHFAFAFAKMTKLKITVLRPFNIYGPRQVGEGAIQSFMQSAIAGTPLQVRGKGDQLRSWCYIDDFIQAAVSTIENKSAYNQIFNIGNPKTLLSSLSLAQKVIEITKSKSKILHIPSEITPIQTRNPDVSKAMKSLRYKPKIGIKEGLMHTYGWFKEHKNI